MPSVRMIEGLPYSLTNPIVRIEIVFPSGKTKLVELSEAQIQRLPTTNGRVIIREAGEEQTFYFAYHVSPDAYIVSDAPVPSNWWSGSLEDRWIPS